MPRALSRRKKNEAPLPLHCTAFFLPSFLPESWLTDSPIFCAPFSLPPSVRQQCPFVVTLEGHLPLQSPASQRKREREPQIAIAIASNTIAESRVPRPFLPPSLAHSLDLQTSRDSVFTQSVIFGGRGRKEGRKICLSLSLWPTTKERARAMIDFFFARTKLSMSHMGEELEVHLSSVLTHHGFDIHD